MSEIYDKPEIDTILDKLQRESFDGQTRTPLGFYGLIWLTALTFKVNAVELPLRQELHQLAVKTRKLVSFQTGDDQAKIISNELDDLSLRLRSLQEQAFDDSYGSQPFPCQVAVRMLGLIHSESLFRGLLERIMGNLFEKKLQAGRHLSFLLQRKRNWSVTSEEERVAIAQVRGYNKQLQVVFELKEKRDIVGEDTYDLNDLLSLHAEFT